MKGLEPTISTTNRVLTKRTKQGEERTISRLVPLYIENY